MEWCRALGRYSSRCIVPMIVTAGSSRWGARVHDEDVTPVGEQHDAAPRPATKVNLGGRAHQGFGPFGFTI